MECDQEWLIKYLFSIHKFTVIPQGKLNPCMYLLYLKPKFKILQDIRVLSYEIFFLIKLTQMVKSLCLKRIIKTFCYLRTSIRHFQHFVNFSCSAGILLLSLQDVMINFTRTCIHLSSINNIYYYCCSRPYKHFFVA